MIVFTGNKPFFFFTIFYLEGKTDWVSPIVLKCSADFKRNPRQQDYFLKCFIKADYFNPFIHNVEKLPNIFLKSHVVETTRFSKYAGPFFNMHEGVN